MVYHSHNNKQRAKEKNRIFTPASDADTGAMKCYTAEGALGLCSSSTEESKVINRVVDFEGPVPEESMHCKKILLNNYVCTGRVPHPKSFFFPASFCM